MVDDNPVVEQTEDDVKKFGEEEGKENKSGAGNEAATKSPKVVAGSCGTDAQVSPEAATSMEEELRKARVKLRKIRIEYILAKQEARESDRAEKQDAEEIAKIHLEDALEEVHILEKKLGTALTNLNGSNVVDATATMGEGIDKQRSNEASSAQRDIIIQKVNTELERRKSGDIVDMDEKALRVYRSRRSTIKNLNDLFERGYRLLVKGSTATKATPNVKNYSDVMIKVKRLFADPMSGQAEGIVESFEALHGVDFSWHDIHDNQLDRCHRWAEYVERASEAVQGTSRESCGEEFHERLPQSSKLLLRIRNPNKVFEDHLSIRNSSTGKGVGVYSERIFYKGAVVSLYLGHPVWSSDTVGGNIPEQTHVIEHMSWKGDPPKAISADHLVPIRDFNGRYYVVCTNYEFSLNKGTHVGQKKFSRLYFGAHFMECEKDGDANAELLEDGSVVALRQIDQNTAIVLRKEKLRTEEEVRAEVVRADDADETSEEEEEAEPIRTVPRMTKANAKIESRLAKVRETVRAEKGVARKRGLGARASRARRTKASAIVQKVINDMSAIATESQWTKFIRLYEMSRDSPNQLATVKNCAAFALGIDSSAAEAEESDGELEEDEEEDSQGSKNKPQVTSNGEELPDDDESWKEGDDDNEDDAEEDVEEEEDVDAVEEEEVESAPHPVVKREKIPQDVIAVAVGSSLKRRKTSQQGPAAKRVNGATAKKRASTSASAPSSTGTSRASKAWQTICAHLDQAS